MNSQTRKTAIGGWLAGTVALLAGLALLSNVHAGITVDAYYRMGEADSPAAVIGGPANATTVDSSGNSRDLTLAGAAKYASATGGTSVAVDLTGSGGYTRSVFNTATDNWGIEFSAFPYTVTTGPSCYLAGNGGGSGGWGIYWHDYQLGALFQNVAFNDMGIGLSPGQWTHYALVRTNGVATFYVNQAARWQTGSSPLAPAGSVYMNTLGLPMRIDEVRLFTVTGAFDPATDLLPNPPPAPSLSSVAWFRCGESDPGATAGGAGNATTKETNYQLFNLDLLRGGTGVTYSANHPTPLGASLLSLQFSGPGVGYYGRSDDSAFAMPTDNFGLELWAKPAVANGTQYLVYDGNGNNGGFGLLLYNGTYQILYGGVLFRNTGVSPIPGTWIHLALARINGTTRFYTNGVEVVSAAFGNAPNLARNGGGGVLFGYDYTGLIDEARIFTINPATFNPLTDLLLTTKATPRGTVVVIY